MFNGGIIYLDGPDGAGKTTLANALKARLESLGKTVVYLHNGKTDDCWKLHFDCSLQIREAMLRGDYVILDRFWVSEYIYGRTYRKGASYPEAGRMFDRLLYTYPSVRVLCSTRPEFAKEEHERLVTERREEFSSGMDRVARLFRQLWVGENTPAAGDYFQQLVGTGGVCDKIGWELYDREVDGDKLPQVVERLLDAVSVSSHVVHSVTLLPDELDTLIGSLTEKTTLLIGDRLNEKKGFIPWAFFHNTSSSLYLVKSLHKLGVDESRIAIVNVNDLDNEGIELLRTIVPKMRRVVALGKEAEKGLLKAHIHYDAAVTHPQHSNRFHHHNNDLYVKQLKEAGV